VATIVDTNVLLDLLTGDPIWADWSQTQLDQAVSRGRLIINQIVFAELAASFERCSLLEDMLRGMGLDVEDLAPGALFLAGKAFSAYRTQRRSKTSVLPDFFIGAHAAVAGLPLLTRDPRRIRTYFPMVELITPAPLR